MAVEIGKIAPQIKLLSHDGQTIQLSDFRGKRVVIFFYPRDMTPTCTQQACDFRDRTKEFAAENTVILGISTDSATRHQKFIDKYDLPYTLLVDDEHKAAETYGVWVEKKMFGNTFMGIERSTFLIDEEGRLRQQWRKVKVKDHVDEVLAAVRQLSKK